MEDSVQWEWGLRVLDYRDYIALNRTLIRRLGLENAVVICELISEARYWLERGQLVDGWFYSTVDNLKDKCGLSKHKQTDALTYLRDNGLIEFENRGIPRRRFVRVNAMKVFSIIDNAQSPLEGPSVAPIGATSRPDLDVNKKNKEILTREVEFQAMRDSQVNSSSTYNLLVSSDFTPPTLDEVRAFCAANMMRHVDPEVFHSWHEARGWVVNGSPIVNWQSALASWEVRDRNKAASEKQTDYSKYDASNWERG